MTIDIDQLTAEDVMHSPVVCTEPDDSLQELHQRLQNQNISGMPVVAGGRLLGVVTQSDLARVPGIVRAMTLRFENATGAPISNRPFDAELAQAPFEDQLSHFRVRDAMRVPAITCERQTSLRETIAKMVGHNIHRIVVVEGEHPVGIVTCLDILRRQLMAG